MGRFQKGNKLAKGGRREGAGRPTVERAAEKGLAAEKAKEIINRNAESLTRRYVKRALGQKADKVLMHAIDKLVPSAKQQVELTGKDDGPITVKTIDGFDWNQYGDLLRSVSDGKGNAHANGVDKSVHSTHTDPETGGLS